MTKACCLATLLCLLALAGCAETDPYKRAQPAPTGDLSASQAIDAYNRRWPKQFKCVQTVTLDFGPITRTLVGYLIVQQPGQFRLQGMTEQGLKIFDIIGKGPETTTVFAADEFDARTLANIARDIRRVYLNQAADVVPMVQTTLGEFGWVVTGKAQVDQAAGNTQVSLRNQDDTLRLSLVGQPARLDRAVVLREGNGLYRLDQYEWQAQAGRQQPTVIVLRERGVESRGPAYKLTIQVTQFTLRDKPWPEKTFEAGP